MKYTEKGVQQRNQFAELGFTDVAGKLRAMIEKTYLLEEIKDKLCKECFNFAA